MPQEKVLGNAQSEEDPKGSESLLTAEACRDQIRRIGDAHRERMRVAAVGHVKNWMELAMLPRDEEAQREIARHLAQFRGGIKSPSAKCVQFEVKPDEGEMDKVVQWAEAIPVGMAVHLKVRSLSEDQLIALGGSEMARKITTLDIRHARVHDWQRLGNLTSMTAIRFSDTNFSDGNIQSLHDCERLEKVSLPFANIQSGGVGVLAAQHPQLHSLDLTGAWILRSDTALLSQLHQLEELRIGMISDGIELDGLASLTGMRTLDLTGDRITDEQLKRLQNMIELRILFLNSNRDGNSKVKCILQEWL